MAAGCKIEGCRRTTRITRGWCRHHYNRWHRNGHPTVEPDIPLDCSPGVSDARLVEVKRVAGDGDLDERCSRLLTHFRWFDPPHVKE